MASTFLDEKISSFIEDKFPEFVQRDHPVFVEFLREYYRFLEASKITLTNVQSTDQLLLENKLTVNYLANEKDGTRFVYEDSVYGAFIKDELVTGQTSGATATILAEDNANNAIYIEANRYFVVGETIVGNTSNASATLFKYQGNPVQNIQQLLEYVNVDNTISDYLDHFRNTYLTAIPNTLATGVSKRKLVKSVRDLYRAKGSRKGHETFFRLMFNETPELTYPTENILKVSAGDWSSDTVLRVIAIENNPVNLVGQAISQTVDAGLEHGVATANVESILQLQEGETTVYQLVLNVPSISGTFIASAEVTGIDNTDADLSISATVQSILVGVAVTDGSAGYTTEDIVNVASATGQNAFISIVDVGSGEVGQVIIDNPGTDYTVGDPLYFDNTNTEGAGATAIVSCIGGAIAPELGDTTNHTVTGTTIVDTTTITSITTTTLYEARQFEITGNTTNGSVEINNITTKNFVIGANISGTGIPANTIITVINIVGDDDDGRITISNAATATGTNILLTHLEEGTGQSITGSSLASDTTIRQITVAGSSNNGTIIISKAATGSATAVTLTIPSEYGMATFDHILFEEATESTDAYSGSQVQFEVGTWGSANGGLNLASESGQVANVTMFSPGSGYEIMPTITPATHRLTYNSSLLTSSGTFVAGETITNDTTPAITATITTFVRGKITISKSSGAFAQGQIITGSNSNAKATLTAVDSLGSDATFLGWSFSGIGSISGVEVTNFGTGFATAPTATVPVKMLLTRNINIGSPPDITLATAFSNNDTIVGQTSNARGTVTVWDNTRQTLTVKITQGTFQKSEVLTRGSSINYAILSELTQGALSTSIGTVGTTAGTFNNDKGKLSESLMKVQDSYYYQDFSYVVKVGAAIKDWRAEIKKSVHPAGFAMFGEVSITSQIATLMTVPVSGITTATPELASLFEAVLTAVIGRRLGTDSDGTTLLGQTEIKGTTDHEFGGTLKRGYHRAHQTPLTSTVESITRSSTTATVETTGPHGVEAGEQVEISGISTAGYDGVYEVVTATDDTFTITVSSSLTTPAVVGVGEVLLISPFDNSTRDVTLRTHKEISVYPIYGGWSGNQRDRYGLGPRQSNATKYMWGAPPTDFTLNGTAHSDTTPQRMDNIGYAYPNIIRRSSPETGTDNVDAGSAGVYDTTMEYTNIQIGAHESDVHMRISDFADVRIIDTVRALRTVGESGTSDMENNGDDVDCILMEDGTYEAYEDAVGNTIPLESRKIWNVPPPSYIRLITA